MCFERDEKLHRVAGDSSGCFAVLDIYFQLCHIVSDVYLLQRR